MYSSKKKKTDEEIERQKKDNKKINRIRRHIED